MKSNMKAADQKRSMSARIRLTAGEAECVLSLADASGLSVSEFFRRSAFGVKINAPRSLPEINRATYSELGRASGNLQRLFSVITSDKRLPPDYSKQLADALVSVKRTCQATQQQILGGD